LRCITGLNAVNGGLISLDGQDLSQIPPHRRVNKGLVLVPEERGIFPDLSVENNFRVGGFIVTDKKELQSGFDWVYGLFPVLKERRHQLAGSLSGGEGSVLGTMVGALIMTVIRSGCSQMGLPNWVQQIITGLIIILAVALDRLRHRQSK